MMVTNAGIEMMEKYGGSFVKTLAKSWRKADFLNKRKLEIMFDYFEEYEQKARRRGQ